MGGQGPLNNVSYMGEQPVTDVSSQRDVGAEWVHSLMVRVGKCFWGSSMPFASPTAFSVTVPLPEICQPCF